jgi:hypothetical protein
VFFHFDLNKSSFFTISAPFTLTMFTALQSEVITVTIFLLTTTFLAIAALKLISIFF